MELKPVPVDETELENLKPDYTSVLEDALELSLELTREKSSLEEIQKEIEYYMSLVKEKKWEQINRQLEALRQGVSTCGIESRSPIF
jgi:hypothetical protein